MSGRAWVSGRAYYKALRPLLFALPPEAAHRLAMRFLECRLLAGGLSAPFRDASLRGGGRNVMGLDFANPVGLAAGFDKNAAHVDALGQLGFGFIEVGGVTEKPQQGTAGRRLFRLPAAEALINRMGFNNIGAAAVAANLRRRRYTGIVGVNLGKNAATKDDAVAGEYCRCLEILYPHGDFFTINISSPNTPGLRDWQRGGRLVELLSAVAAARDSLAARHARRAPLALKISPDMDDEAMRRLAAVVGDCGCDAVVACNTTLARPPEVAALPFGGERGGLSGKPLAARATEVIKLMRAALPAEVAIIGVGGVFSIADAAEKLAAGADLVQLYTGLIYEGWNLPGEIVRGLPAAGDAANDAAVAGGG